MDPTRTATINGHAVREYYWAGEYPVYVDSQLRAGSFEDICAALSKETGQ